MSPQGGGGQVLARVDKVILGPTDASGRPDPDFEANGRWSSVGSIRYTVMYGSQPVPANSPVIARPTNPNIAQFPILGEIVELIPGPSSKLNDDSTAKQLYYRIPINLWNNVHHNSLLNVITLLSQTPQTKPTYQEATRGANSAPVPISKAIKLGNTFKEKSYIKNLQPFEGDITIQGRWGQSMRFGSTVKGGDALNPWSSAGDNGDPITIIRNGQGERSSTNPFTTTIEDINTDGASIYLCSGQVIIIADIANFVNANLLATFTVGSKLEEAQVQRPNTTPISTDTKSPASQSKAELEYAQASSNTVVPSLVPQSKTTVTYNQPVTGSNPTATVTTQVTNPDGTVSTTVITTPIDPNQPKDTGQIATTAITTPNKVTTSESNIPNNSADTQNQAKDSKTKNQIVVQEDGLEVIESEESNLRFGFDIGPYGVLGSDEADAQAPDPIGNSNQEVGKKEGIRGPAAVSNLGFGLPLSLPIVFTSFLNRAKTKDKGTPTKFVTTHKGVDMCGPNGSKRSNSTEYANYGTINKFGDTRGTTGDPVFAVADGVVVWSGERDPKGFGCYISIKHTIGSKKYTTVYGHIPPQSITVKSGDKVTKGQQIALVGNEGAAGFAAPNNYHLHFEIWEGDAFVGTQVDPLDYIPIFSTLGGFVSSDSLNTQKWYS